MRPRVPKALHWVRVEQINLWGVLLDLEVEGTAVRLTCRQNPRRIRFQVQDQVVGPQFVIGVDGGADGVRIAPLGPGEPPTQRE